MADLSRYLTPEATGSSASPTAPFSGHPPDGAFFNLWKSAGDELLFWGALRSTEQAALATAALRNALLRWHEERRAASASDIAQQAKPVIDLKATAWLAGIPVRNVPIELALQRPAIKGESLPRGIAQYDFIGPSIDAGFRLTARATKDRMPVSAELALMIARIQTRHSEGLYPGTRTAIAALRLAADRSATLKGVLLDRRYPNIWVDLHDAAAQANDPVEETERAMLRDTAAKLSGENTSSVEAYCTVFLTTPPVSLHLGVPFITGDNEFPGPPKGYENDLQHALSAYAGLGGGSDQLVGENGIALSPAEQGPLNSLIAARQK